MRNSLPCVFCEVFIKVKIEPVRGPWGYSTTNLKNNSSEQAASVYFGKQTACSKPLFHPLKRSASKTNGSPVCRWHWVRSGALQSCRRPGSRTTLSIWGLGVITPMTGIQMKISEEEDGGWRTRLTALDTLYGFSPALEFIMNKVMEDVAPCG